MKILKLMFLGLIIASSISCSKDDEVVVPDITINDFVGSWKATSAKFTNNSNTGETFNFIASGGEIRFTMLNGGGVRTWISIGSFADEWDAQATLKDNNTLITTPVEASRDTEKNTFVMNGNTLTLTNTSTRFDFTLSEGTEVSSTSVIVFQRN